METSQLIYGALIMLLGGVVQGLAGFGLALTTVPVLILFLPHTVVPPVLVTIGFLNNLMVLHDTRRAITPAIIWPLIIGGAIGLPIGALLLKNLDFSIFKLLVGGVVLLAAIAMLLGWRLRLRLHWSRLSPVGLISGVLGGATALSGPPVILFFAGQDGDKQAFRGNLMAYFTLLNFLSIIAFACFGLLTREVWVACGWLVLPLIIGTLIGIWLAKKFSEQLFRRIVLALIALIGISLIITNLRGVFSS